ncbi:MAG: DNA internalization-related competence protein ComEC/Rec2 [Elusimicrobia bacterium]|nr:DNA internalization-related competence protein ComEC/Rec2 [Elusimicrobiota bacterium]
MKRPLIVITVLYIIIIVLLDTLGVLNKIPSDNIARQAVGNTVKITGKINTEPEKINNRTSFILETEKINDNATKGEILVNIYTDKIDLSYGDIIDITGKFFKPNPSSVLGAFDYKKYLFRKKIYATLSVNNEENVNVIGRNPSYLWQLSLKLRKQILASYYKNLLPQQAAVLSGITIGARSGLTPYIQKIFVDAGVMHVLVASGSNVAFVAVIFFWIFRNIFKLKKKFAFGLLIPIILLYTMITGGNPPVVRATIMTLTVILAMLLSRNADVYQGLFLAALIILIYNPLTLFEAGFQMSFVATIGIVYLYPKFQSALQMQKLPGIFNWFLSIFFASLSAQIAIAPVLAYYFNKVSLIAIISNLIILPLIGVLLAAGFILYLTSLIGTQLLIIVAKITGGIISFMIYMIDFFANIPHSTIRTPTPSIFFLIIFYLVIIGIPKMRNYLWKWLVIIALTVLIISSFFNNSLRNKNNLSVTFLDVGLGDAVFCEFPDGSNMLIDGGGNWEKKYDIGETIISPFLWNKGITKIDTVILTHPHINHYQGLIAVCKNFKIKKFITIIAISEESEYSELMEIINSKKIPFERISKPKILEIGKVNINILNPEIISKNNDANSMVLRLLYNEFSILLCSDISMKTQKTLVKKPTASNILLVPNHGKKKLSHDFLLQISPEFAIISTNAASLKVLEQLKRYKLFTTANSGTIIIDTNGKTCNLKETLIDAPMEMIILD